MIGTGTAFGQQIINQYSNWGKYQYKRTSLVFLQKNPENKVPQTIQHIEHIRVVLNLLLQFHDLNMVKAQTDQETTQSIFQRNNLKKLIQNYMLSIRQEDITAYQTLVELQNNLVTTQQKTEDIHQVIEQIHQMENTSNSLIRMNHFNQISLLQKIDTMKYLEKRQQVEKEKVVKVLSALETYQLKTVLKTLVENNLVNREVQLQLNQSNKSRLMTVVNELLQKSDVHQYEDIKKTLHQTLIEIGEEETFLTLTQIENREEQKNVSNLVSIQAKEISLVQKSATMKYLEKRQQVEKEKVVQALSTLENHQLKTVFETLVESNIVRNLQFNQSNDATFITVLSEMIRRSDVHQYEDMKQVLHQVWIELGKKETFLTLTQIEDREEQKNVSNLVSIQSKQISLVEKHATMKYLEKRQQVEKEKVVEVLSTLENHQLKTVVETLVENNIVRDLQFNQSHDTTFITVLSEMIRRSDVHQYEDMKQVLHQVWAELGKEETFLTLTQIENKEEQKHVSNLVSIQSKQISLFEKNATIKHLEKRQQVEKEKVVEVLSTLENHQLKTVFETLVENNIVRDLQFNQSHGATLITVVSEMIRMSDAHQYKNMKQVLHQVWIELGKEETFLTSTQTENREEQKNISHLVSIQSKQISLLEKNATIKHLEKRQQVEKEKVIEVLSTLENHQLKTVFETLVENNIVRDLQFKQSNDATLITVVSEMIRMSDAHQYKNMKQVLHQVWVELGKKETFLTVTEIENKEEQKNVSNLVSIQSKQISLLEKNATMKHLEKKQQVEKEKVIEVLSKLENHQLKTVVETLVENNIVRDLKSNQSNDTALITVVSEIVRKSDVHQYEEIKKMIHQTLIEVGKEVSIQSKQISLLEKNATIKHLENEAITSAVTSEKTKQLINRTNHYKHTKINEYEVKNLEEQYQVFAEKQMIKYDIQKNQQQVIEEAFVEIQNRNYKVIEESNREQIYTDTIKKLTKQENVERQNSRIILEKKEDVEERIQKTTTEETTELVRHLRHETAREQEQQTRIVKKLEKKVIEQEKKINEFVAKNKEQAGNQGNLSSEDRKRVTNDVINTLQKELRMEKQRRGIV